MRFRLIGDTAFAVSGLESAAGLAAALAAGPRPPGVRDVSAAFDTVTVVYDATIVPDMRPLDRLTAWVETVAAAPPSAAAAVNRTTEIPVRYGRADGPDLPALAAAAGLSPTRLIAGHAGATYAVAAIGFLPGFAYLDGLPKRLHAARRPTPRIRVPAGSVAIGGPYTGVYPVASPGGWHVIGRTALRLFDPAAPAAVPLRVGDRVRFVAVGP